VTAAAKTGARLTAVTRPARAGRAPTRSIGGYEVNVPEYRKDWNSRLRPSQAKTTGAASDRYCRSGAGKKRTASVE